MPQGGIDTRRERDVKEGKKNGDNRVQQGIDQRDVKEGNKNGDARVQQGIDTRSKRDGKEGEARGARRDKKGGDARVQDKKNAEGGGGTIGGDKGTKGTTGGKCGGIEDKCIYSQSGATRAGWSAKGARSDGKSDKDAALQN